MTRPLSTTTSTFLPLAVVGTLEQGLKRGEAPFPVSPLCQGSWSNLICPFQRPWCCKFLHLFSQHFICVGPQLALLHQSKKVVGSLPGLVASSVPAWGLQLPLTLFASSPLCFNLECGSVASAFDTLKSQQMIAVLVYHVMQPPGA